MKKYVLYFLAVSCLLSTARADPANLIPNPGFEQGRGAAATGWRLAFWQPPGQSRSWGRATDTVAHSGRRSVAMSGSSPGSHAYWSCRGMSAAAGRRYVLTAWVRPHGVLPPKSRCQIHVGFQDESGKIIADAKHPFYSGWAYTTLTGYCDWGQIGLETTAPPRTASASVTLRFVGMGDAWFDDVRLVQSDTASVPVLGPNIARTATCEAPDHVFGETEVTLIVQNPYEQTIRGLAISATGPGAVTGASRGPVDIQPGARARVPVALRFPRYFNSGDARILLTGRYRLGNQARQARWLISLRVIAADVAEAVRSRKWGLNEGRVAAAAAPPLDILGCLIHSAGGTKYVSRYTPFPLSSPKDGLAFVVRLTGRDSAAGKIELHWECLDHFFRSASGKRELDLRPGQQYLAKIDLPETQARRIYRSGRDAGTDSLSFACTLRRAGKKLASQRREFRFRVPKTAYPRLSPVEERFDELPVFGRLKLVDEVLCGDPKDPHPLRQGGKGQKTKYSSEPLGYYGGSSLLNYDWRLEYRDPRDEFTRLETVLGKSCRVAENWAWFSFRMGRGKLTPGKEYVLAIEYPQDRSRNFLIWNQIDSRASFGFHTGSALGDPFTRQRFMQRIDLPLSGRYEHQYSLLTARRQDGWIAIHSMGNRVAPFSKGVAVHAIRLYELGGERELDKLALQVHEPEGLPRRLLGFIAEDATPSAAEIARYRFYGLNFYAPLTLSYCGGTYETNSGFILWPSKLFGPENLKNPHALATPGYYRTGQGSIENILKTGDRSGMAILPVLEYGGTGQLPAEAFAIRPAGSTHHYHWGTTVGPAGRRTTRYLKDGTCIDFAHPLVGDDLAKLMTEIATLYAPRHSSFGGVILTQRFQAWQISYSDFEMERFAKDRGVQLPQTHKGRWVFEHRRADFRNWYYERKRENLLRATAALRAVSPKLCLVVLNYNGGDDNLHFGTPLYWWDKEKGDELLVPGAVSLPDMSTLDLKHMIEDYTRPDVAGLSVGMNPPLYRKDRGIWNLAVAHYPFLCGNADYLNHFRTGEGSAVCFWWIYNEDAYGNDPALGWNCPGLKGNEPAGRYCMLDEILAMAVTDPFIMGVRIGNLNRGFPRFAREFAAAYRALPALPSKILHGAVDDPKVVVRRYDAGNRVYLAVVNTGLARAGKRVRLHLPGSFARITNAATGEVLPVKQGAVELRLEPVQLIALKLEPTERANGMP